VVPPLTTSVEDLRAGIAVIDDALGIADAHLA
jgi:hypothetical protein